MKYVKGKPDRCILRLYRGWHNKPVVFKVKLYDNNPHYEFIMECVRNNSYCDVELRDKVVVCVTIVSLTKRVHVMSVLPAEENTVKISTSDGVMFASSVLDISSGFSYLVTYTYNKDDSRVIDSATDRSMS